MGLEMRSRDRKALVMQYATVIFIILVLNFFLPRMMPGDPFLILSADTENEVISVLTEEQRTYFKSYYGLDRPVHKQFISYLASWPEATWEIASTIRCRSAKRYGCACPGLG